jgi:hypothetical protein
MYIHRFDYINNLGNVMIPIWTEDSVDAIEFARMGDSHEDCVLCKDPTQTWHENTNNPVCKSCASKYKVSDIPEDHGILIRKRKREGKFNRGDSVRVSLKESNITTANNKVKQNVSV